MNGPQAHLCNFILSLSGERTVVVSFSEKVSVSVFLKAFAYWENFREVFSPPRSYDKDTVRMHIVAKDEPDMSVEEFKQICRVCEAIEFSVTRSDSGRVLN
jgi:hypothetical protein